MRRIVATAVTLGLVALLASSAAGQGAVDLRVQLSTQPVYGGYAPGGNYLGLSNLYSTGNIRGGRAFRGNRNFLEDRYFTGSLSRFHRDSVGVGDVTAGGMYGPGQPLYAPGSLLSRGSTVRMYSPSGAAPSGLSFNPATTLPTPFQTIYTVRTEPQVPFGAQLPAPAALRQYLQESMRTEPAPVRAPLFPPLIQTAATQENPLPELPQVMKLDLTFMPKDDADTSGLDEEDRPAAAPWESDPADAEQPTEGIRTMDFLRSRYGQGAAATREVTGDETPRPGLQPITLDELGEDGKEAPTELVWQQVGQDLPGRPARFDEQYLELARLEMAAGAYRPAAESFSKSADFNPLRHWEANRGEAFARLLSKEYFLAAHLLKTTIVGKPAHLRKDFRLTEIVDRPEDWAAAERGLVAVLAKSPRSSNHAFALGCLRLFSGRAAEAAPLLKVAEKNEKFAEAVKILREKVMP